MLCSSASVSVPRVGHLDGPLDACVVAADIERHDVQARSSEKASSRRSSSSISSLSDVVDRAGVHARTSSVNSACKRLAVAVDAGAQGAHQRLGPRLVRRHRASSFALADSNSASVSTPDRWSSPSSFRSPSGSRSAAGTAGATRRVDVELSPAAAGCTRPAGCGCAAGERHPRLAGPVQEQHARTAGCYDGEDLRLLRLELGVGEDPLVLELGQLLAAARSDPAAGAGPEPGQEQAGRTAAAARSTAVAARTPAASLCCVQRLAWRRDTRLETAVAVPATTAVRATPLSSPGMSSSFLVCGLPDQPASVASSEAAMSASGM